ncbi:MAG TPA: hypothetical protein VGP95_04795, partial [Gemmatimonadaceae bacterium]|nr:hypothetical protein [Gemmatimonadaceae bacterium]
MSAVDIAAPAGITDGELEPEAQPATTSAAPRPANVRAKGETKVDVIGRVGGGGLAARLLGISASAEPPSRRDAEVLSVERFEHLHHAVDLGALIDLHVIS